MPVQIARRAWELPARIADSGSTMATPTRTRTQDRRRVSAQRHEISYAASRLEKGGRGKAAATVKRAKSQLGRKTSRPKVMARARAISRRS